MPSTDPLIILPERAAYASVSDAVFDRTCERYKVARMAYWASGDETGTRRFLGYLFDRLLDNARAELDSETERDIRLATQRAEFKAQLDLSLETEGAVYDTGPRYVALPPKVRSVIDNLRARLGYLMAGRISGRDKTYEIENTKEQIAELVTGRTADQRRTTYFLRQSAASLERTDQLLSGMFSVREMV